MSIQALRDKRQAKAKEARNLVEQNPGAAWTEEINGQYQALVAEIDQVDAEIARHERLLAIEARNLATGGGQAGAIIMGGDRGAADPLSAPVIFNAWLRGGHDALTPEQRQIMAEARRQVQNTMTTTGSTQGAELVPREFAGRLIEALKAYGGLRQVATIVSTDTGAPMDWPTTNATAETGELVGENADVTPQDASFGTAALNTYKFSSKSVAVPFELLQDSAVDLEGHIAGRLQTRLGRITNQMYTTGSGTGQPMGVVTAASAGKVGATGQTATILYADLVDLEHSVDPAYRRGGSCGFMFHDSTLKVLKKMLDSQNRPLWLPGVATKEPDTLLGYPYTANQDMAAMAANAKSVLFGDFSYYIIRDVMQVLLFRLTDSAFTLKGQVGFVAFMRSTGNLVDGGGGAVKYYQNAAS